MVTGRLQFDCIGSQPSGKRFNARSHATLAILAALLMVNLAAAQSSSPSSVHPFDGAGLIRTTSWADLSTCDATGCDGSSCDAMFGTTCGGACCSGSLCDVFHGKGVTFAGNLTQFYFGTVDGGVSRTDRYGGHGDYLAKLDLGQLGVHENLLLQLRAEHRFGRSIVEPTGALLPATLATELPVVDSRELYLTNVLFTYLCSPNFAVFAGKLDTLDGDQNAYASGRGITQFSNAALVANPIALRTIPYASLGCGFAVLENGEPLLNFLLINPTDTADSDGFDELFADGVAMSTELRFPTYFGNRIGHQLFAGTWSSRDFVRLNQDPRIVLPNIPIARSSGSWSLYWNMDQAVWVDRCDPSRHWGFFARAGIADDSNNPISYLLSAGLGGASPLRKSDTFGLGYFYSGTSNEVDSFLQAILGPIGDGQGVELFYRSQVTECISVTPDFQWISPARKNIDDAYVLGLRTNIAF